MIKDKAVFLSKLYIYFISLILFGLLFYRYIYYGDWILATIFIINIIWLMYLWGSYLGWKRIILKTIINILSLRAKLDGFEVRKAEPQDMEEVFKLRYKVYCEEKGYMNPNNLQMSFDEYDHYSTIFIVRYKKKMVSTIRMTYNSHLGFDIEKYFNINFDKYNKNNMVYLGRWVTLRKYRRGDKYHNKLVFESLIYLYMLHDLYKNRTKYLFLYTMSNLINSLSRRFKFKFLDVDDINVTEYNLKNRKKDFGKYFENSEDNKIKLLNIDNIDYRFMIKM